MKIKVLLFAHLREIVGANSIELELNQDSKGDAVLDSLQEQFPEIEKHRNYLKLSMNGDYIDSNTALIDNSEVAVFPPVSGG